MRRLQTVLTYYHIRNAARKFIWIEHWASASNASWRKVAYLWLQKYKVKEIFVSDWEEVWQHDSFDWRNVASKRPLALPCVGSWQLRFPPSIFSSDIVNFSRTWHGFGWAHWRNMIAPLSLSRTHTQHMQWTCANKQPMMTMAIRFSFPFFSWIKAKCQLYRGLLDAYHKYLITIHNWGGLQDWLPGTRDTAPILAFGMCSPKHYSGSYENLNDWLVWMITPPDHSAGLKIQHAGQIRIVLVSSKFHVSLSCSSYIWQTIAMENCS